MLEDVQCTLAATIPNLIAMNWELDAGDNMLEALVRKVAMRMPSLVPAETKAPSLVRRKSLEVVIATKKDAEAKSNWGRLSFKNPKVVSATKVNNDNGGSGPSTATPASFEMSGMSSV